MKTQLNQLKRTQTLRALTTYPMRERTQRIPHTPHLEKKVEVFAAEACRITRLAECTSAGSFWMLTCLVHMAVQHATTLLMQVFVHKRCWSITKTKL